MITKLSVSPEWVEQTIVGASRNLIKKDPAAAITRLSKFRGNIKQTHQRNFNVPIGLHPKNNRALSTSYQMEDEAHEALGKLTKQALLDELVKIAEESPPKKEGFGKALRAMGTAAAGGALGYGAAELMGRNMKFFSQPNERRTTAARIILPILSGTAVMLADRYRQRLNEEYSKTKGYKDDKR